MRGAARAGSGVGRLQFLPHRGGELADRGRLPRALVSRGGEGRGERARGCLTIAAWY